MKVLFDSSVMSLALLENVAMHKTGVFRYAENIAKHLSLNPQVELSFYSSLDRREKNLWKRKLEELKHLKNVPLLNHYHPLRSRMDRLKHHIIDATPVKKFFLKGLCESLRIIVNTSPHLVGNISGQDIYYSPYHPLPKRVREKKGFDLFYNHS